MKLDKHVVLKLSEKDILVRYPKASNDDPVLAYILDGSRVAYRGASLNIGVPSICGSYLIA